MAIARRINLGTLQEPDQDPTDQVRRIGGPMAPGPISPGAADLGPPDASGHLPPLAGNPETPRDRPDVGPGTTNAPGGVQRNGLPGGAPPMPMAPSPVAAMSPRPFTPMAPPRGITGSALAPSSNLLGKAGGLLGGGLGVPGTVSGDTQDISGLIQMLLAKMRGGQ